MRILQLSDTHLCRPGALHYGTVDTGRALEATLTAAEDITDLDVVLVSGDVSDDGTAESYRRASEAVGAFADRHRAATAFLMGNHDRPDTFERVLGARTGVLRAGGGTVIRLDSSVPGQGHGEIGPDQLAWLQGALAEASGPVVVAVHHPPVPAGTPLLAALELQRPGELLHICRRERVAAILCGHYHRPMVSAGRRLPVVVAPGVANLTDLGAPAGHERARRGAGFAIVDVDDDGTVTASMVPVPHPEKDGEVIFDLSPGDVARIAAGERPRSDP